jgi:hypothetical protein
LRSSPISTCFAHGPSFSLIVVFLQAAQQIIAANGGKFDDDEMERDFAMYFDQLRQEMKEAGEVEEIDEMEARQYFMVMRKQFEAMEESMSDSELKEMISKGDMEEAESADTIPTLARGRKPPMQEFSDIMKDLKTEWGEDGDDIEIEEWSDDDEMDEVNGEAMERSAAPSLLAQGSARWKGLPEAQSTEHSNVVTKAMEELSMESQAAIKDDFAPSNYSVGPSVEAAHKEFDALTDDDFELDELRELLPGLPASRLRRVRQAYQQALSDPSLLTLVPILRETMPVSVGASFVNLFVLSPYSIALQLVSLGLVYVQVLEGKERTRRAFRVRKG